MMSREMRHSILILANLMVVLMLSIFFARSLNASQAVEVNLQSETAVKSSVTMKPRYSNKTISETVNLINDYRSENGLNVLNQSSELDAVANKRAADMRKNGYYSHFDKSGRDFSSLVKNSSDKFACENLNMNTAANASQFFNSWISSKAGHKECILNKKISKAGYATVKVSALNGINIDQHIIVAIYSE